MRPFAAQQTAVDDHPRRAAFLADGERRDHDMRLAAIVFERSRMADERYDLAFHFADAAERIAAEHASVRRGACAPLVAVGQKPIVDTVA
jgi:hypothetical protein